MSALTLADLLAAETAPFDRAAQAWERLAEDPDNAAEELVHQTRTLEYAWPTGSGSAAAYTEAATLRSEVSNAYNPARQIAQALLRHAEAMRSHLSQAQEIVSIPIIGPALIDAYDDAHGPSPHEQDFGANQFRVDTSGHSAYWDKGSQSLANQARIIIGEYGMVGLDHGQHPTDWRG